MVTVTATDSDGLDASKDVTIKVTDVDEAPEITVGGLAISGIARVDYAEDRRDAVATYRASGPDADMATWTLEGAGRRRLQTSAAAVCSPSGVRRTSRTQRTCRHGTTMYQVTVEADDGTDMDTHDVTVTVTEVEDDVVTPGDSVVDMYDANNSGRIDKDELVNAVFDYNVEGTLEKDQLVELVFSYNIG